ncbi:MAG: histidine kinase [Eubacteriales bacterium]|nr:histidine kinase [Eubacteriales bacterium]
MKAKRNNNKPYVPFQRKLILGIASLTVFLVIAVAVISYQLASRKIEEAAALQSESNITFVQSTLNTLYDEIENWTTEVLQSPSIRSAAEYTDSPGPVVHNLIFLRLMNMTSKALENGLRFPTVGLYLMNGDVSEIGTTSSFPFSSYDDCLAYFSLSEAASTKYIPAFFSICSIKDTQSDKPLNRLVYVRFLYEQVTMKKLGVFVVEIENDAIFEKIGYISNRCVVISEDGTILVSSNPRELGATYSNKNLLDYIVSQSRMSGTITNNESLTGDTKILSYCSVFGNSGYLIAPFDYYSEMNRLDVEDYLKSLLVFILISVVTAIFFTIILSGRLSASIQQLTAFVKHVYSGQFNERYTASGNDEIAYLGEKINDMLDKIETASREREIDLKNQQIMELRLMQSQINPHLLYNTLDSVLWAIQNDNTENATELIGSLSGFFRLALSRGVERIPLQKEIRLVETYINIQRLARNQNVTLIKTIQDDLLDYSIIKLTLQPLVENAYLHGFAGYRDDGTITINASHDETCLTITVTDNGIGMMPDEVEAVNAYLQANSLSDNSHSVGLFNVNRRIIHEYGREYGLSIVSEVSEYTTVTVKLPYFMTTGENTYV